jgi:glutamate 5-kinase
VNDFSRIIIKLGTSTLTDGTTYLSPPRIINLVRQVANLHHLGKEVILVSSGAMAAGKEALNFPQLPKQIPAKQMLAAIGQPKLMNLYTQLFGYFGIVVSQVLLTRSDIDNRRSYLNARNTLLALLEQKVIPIVNENDTVATEEIRVGDNDNLSARVANLVEADLLMLLTDQPGIFSADPRAQPDATMFSEISTQEIPADVWNAASGSKSGLGTGGMATKIQAADLARKSGTTVVVCRGADPEIITEIANGVPKGTWFRPAFQTTESRKRYLLITGHPDRGSVLIDDGAVRAVKMGGSLLPIGVIKLEGSFDRGDSISLKDSQGKNIGHGIVNYNLDQLMEIMGKHSGLIEDILGFTYGEEVIHRNNMVLLV